MRDLACGAPLVVELREPAILVCHPAGQELEGDRLIEREIVGAIHWADAAAPEQGDEPVATRDDGAWRKSRPAPASVWSPL